RFCSTCGASFQETGASAQGARSDDAPSGGFAVLGFFIPLVGLILYLVWMKDYPLKAKSCGKGALIGFITNIALGICYGIVLGSGLLQGL
ncbi:MAG: zinc ribbon domain-containing protein, partial [Bacilli bacterium]|nr:zinc ribbon domain-containing protein [Bacilli bacterium]